MLRERWKNSHAHRHAEHSYWEMCEAHGVKEIRYASFRKQCSQRRADDDVYLCNCHSYDDRAEEFHHSLHARVTGVPYRNEAVPFGKKGGCLKSELNEAAEGYANRCRKYGCRHHVHESYNSDYDGYV